MDQRPCVAVGAICLDHGSILLIRRGQPPSEGCWSVPGGRVEWGETLAAALRREVEEETGLDVEVGSLAGIVERRYPPDFHYVILDYHVTLRGGTLRAGGDVTDASWVPLDGLTDLPLSEGLLESLRDFGLPLPGA
ncbi:MAG: NUDIX hydrolase [Actinomycetota bacterium]